MDRRQQFDTNRRRWDESADIHFADENGFYRVEQFRQGADVLGSIEAGEIGDVSGKSLLHLQCHFGLDTLCLARRGARVTGLDFSSRAIEHARSLATETGLDARFVEGNLYDAPRLIDGQFDLTYTTWGTIVWLPDLPAWGRIIAHFLKPGGQFYFLDGHPAALMLDDAGGGPLTPRFNYFGNDTPLVFDDAATYTGTGQSLKNARAYEWTHPVSEIVTSLIGAGLRIDAIAEHTELPWQLFSCMEKDARGKFVMPEGHPSIPLALSIKATRP